MSQDNVGDLSNKWVCSEIVKDLETVMQMLHRGLFLEDILSKLDELRLKYRND